MSNTAQHGRKERKNTKEGKPMLTNEKDYTYRWPIGYIPKKNAYEYDTLVGNINKTLLDFVLSTLREAGFKTKKLNTGDTYFIFSGSPYSRNNFRLTGLLPGWIFGIWIEGQLLLTDEYEKDAEVTSKTSVIELFCQHTTLIDKFKPSRSPVVAKITLQDMQSMLKGEEWAKHYVKRKIQDLARSVKQHPALVYNDATYPEYPPVGHFIPSMIKTATEDTYQRIYDNIALRIGIKWAKKMQAKAEKHPAFSKVSLRHNPTNEKIHMWPPVSLICQMDENLTLDQQQDAIYEIFDTDQYGKLCQIGDVVRVDFWAGQGDDRGWYCFFENAD